MGSWNERAAFSSCLYPMTHQGQTTSEIISTVMDFDVII